MMWCVLGHVQPTSDFGRKPSGLPFKGGRQNFPECSALTKGVYEEEEEEGAGDIGDPWIQQMSVHWYPGSLTVSLSR